VAEEQDDEMIGLYLRSVIYDGLQGIALGPFIRGLKWSPEDVEVFLVGVRKSLMDASPHSYLLFHVVYGQSLWNLEMITDEVNIIVSRHVHYPTRGARYKKSVLSLFDRYKPRSFTATRVSYNFYTFD
jgi:hypothetical protein